MIVSLLVAMDEGRGIGAHNGVPWRLRADLRHFKKLTMGRTLIMGRKTYESIGKPLPGRTTIVLTRQPEYAAGLPEGCLAAHSIHEALALAEARGEQEVFVVGGGEVYALTLPLADRIYLTQVHARVQADTFFPPLDPNDWDAQELMRCAADDQNQYPFTIYLLSRKRRATGR